MFKALITKQFLELFSRLLVSPNAGKKNKKQLNLKTKQKVGAVIFAAVYLLIFMSMFAMACGMADALLTNNLPILYFSIFGLLTFIVGAILNLFIASNTLFDSKDNELLLSLPIPPTIILVSRMTTLIINCLIFSGFVWIPCIVAYVVFAGFSMPVVASCALNFLNISLFILSVSCVFGYLFSLLNRFAKFKKIISIVFMVIIILIAMFSSGLIRAALAAIVQNPEMYSSVFQQYLGPFVAFGQSCMGDTFSLLSVSAVCFLLFIVICVVVSKAYVKLLTSQRHSKKKVYVAKNVAVIPIGRALLKKEFKLLGHYTIYMINTCLGLVFAVILVVGAIVMRDMIPMLILMLDSTGLSRDIVPALVALAMCMFAMMNAISTPAMSMEGRQMWILKSMPIKPAEVLKAKLNLHVIVNATGFCLCGAAIQLIVGGISLNVVYVVVLVFLYVVATGQFGLAIGTKRANLTWTNPAIPVKQNLAVLFSILYGFLLIIISCSLYYVISILIGATGAIVAVSLLLVIVVLVQKKFLYSHTQKDFAKV